MKKRRPQGCAADAEYVHAEQEWRQSYLPTPRAQTEMAANIPPDTNVPVPYAMVLTRLRLNMLRPPFC